MELKGYVNGGALENPNFAKERPELLEQAYKMGKNI
jgi:hypothetical protein